MTVRSQGMMPQVNPENLKRGRCGVEQLLRDIETLGFRPPPKNKLVMRDFTKENIKRIRQIQAANRWRGPEKSVPLKTSKDNDQYRDIPSRLSVYFETGQLESIYPQRKKDFVVSNSSLRRTASDELKHARHSNKALSLPNSDSVRKGISFEGPVGIPPPECDTSKLCHQDGNQERIQMEDKYASSSFHDQEIHEKVPKLHLEQSQAPSELSNNKTLCTNSGKSKPPMLRRSLSSSHLNHPNTAQDTSVKAPDDYHRGEIPKYLIQRRRKWAEEEEMRRQEAPDPAIPPGHIALSQPERLEMLASLKRDEEVLYQQLAALPVHASTMRLQLKKQTIEKQLSKVEEAIRVFSKPKVFIKKDS